MLLLIALPLVFCSASALQSTVNRDVSVELILETGAIAGLQHGWGPSSRKADHATVAINSERDICVVFHTDRDQDLGTNIDLKQVEAILYRYIPANDSWSRSSTILLGSVERSPLFSTYPQTLVKCERPDVIAVGNRFFVTWTRRYDRLAHPEEPAVAECAWIEWSFSQSAFIATGSGSVGEGFPLDYDGNDHDLNSNTLPTLYRVRECAGVPDAVVLVEDAGGTSSVGVAYPHQTDFGDLPGNLDDTRLFDLRFITSVFDGSAISKDIPQVLVGGIPFHGTPEDSAGMILPDLARASLSERFILAYEEQQLGVTPGTSYGMIRLKVFEFSSSQMSWGELATYTFGGPAVLQYKRRPNVSSFPLLGSGLEVITIAFNKPSALGDKDVVYEQWQFSNSGIFRVPWPIGVGWPNTAQQDFRPLPLHGTTSPFFRRCYAERETGAGTCQILEYDVDTNAPPTVLATIPNIGRPAASFLYVPSAASPLYAAVTWEGPGIVQQGTKIILRVR